eukprot:1187967-Prorocentrum_minimum.AAC.4
MLSERDLVQERLPALGLKVSLANVNLTNETALVRVEVSLPRAGGDSTHLSQSGVSHLVRSLALHLDYQRPAAPDNTRAPHGHMASV